MFVDDLVSPAEPQVKEGEHKERNLFNEKEKREEEERERSDKGKKRERLYTACSSSASLVFVNHERQNG
ncbi:hypothetical protein LB503_000502 [Fusarium chuoi]|nr:hypothetical protein LB503_000502 [Fusarium chuoi]